MMSYQDNQFISPESLYWKGVLHDVAKSRSALQPIFEAFTNAIEAVQIRKEKEPDIQGDIQISIFAIEETVGGHTHFKSLSILDNGIGFDDEQFKRFNTFKDITKGFKNLGSGRIQFVHHFDNTLVNSIFNQEGDFFEREFYVSKKKYYLDQNAIVLHKHCKIVNSNEIGTKISFNSLIENSNIYNNLNELELKEQLLKRYIHYFCHNKESLPNISIKFFVESKLIKETKIGKSDIPNIDYIYRCI